MKRKILSLSLALTVLLTSAGLPALTGIAAPGFDAEIYTETSDDDNISLFDEGDDPTDPSDTATDITSDFNAATDGVYTITADGNYEIKEYNGSNRVVVLQGISASLTVNNVSISASSAAPITVESGATLTLHAEGANTFTAPASYAGISVLAENTNTYGTLIIDGSGSLTAKGGNNGAGIGADYSFSSGKIVINGADITAAGGTQAAGIGGANQTSFCGDIVINGGSVTATGGTRCPGIGAGYSGTNGNITVNGGYIKAIPGKKTAKVDLEYSIGGTYAANKLTVNGGSIDAVIQSGITPKNDMGETVSLHTFVMPDDDVDTMKEKTVTVNTWTTKTDSDAKLYIYLPDSAAEFAASYDDGSENTIIYYTEDMSVSETPVKLNKYTGTDGCLCSPDEEHHASVNLKTNDKILEETGTVTVNKYIGSKTVNVISEFTKSDDCTFPLHNVSTEYTLSVDGETGDISSLASLSGSSLTVYYAAADKTVRLSVSASVNGQTYTGELAFNVTADDSSRLDLALGNINISKSSQDGMTEVKAEGTTYTIPNDTKITIYQSDNHQNRIVVGSDLNITIALENLNIITPLYGSPLDIGARTTLTLELIGSNLFKTETLTPAVSGTADSTKLIFTGSGSFEAVSGSGAGIPTRNVTVNSGTVIARGGNGGAGIGGSEGLGGTVTVNGGRVYAYGDGNGAGIGGGSNATTGKGGTFIMNGGMVYAESAEGGSGIGSGGVTKEIGKRNNGKGTEGTITLNGGSLNTTFYDEIIPNVLNGQNVSDEEKYLVTLDFDDEVKKQEYVSYTVGDNNDKIQTSTDENGKLYLYLPKGYQWIRVYKTADGEEITYYKYVDVLDYEPNSGTAVREPLTRLNSFEIFGGTTDYSDMDENIIRVTVPESIILQSIKPDVLFDGAMRNPSPAESMNFDNQDKKAALTIIGEDMSEKVYTVYLTLEPKTQNQDIYDLSKGKITITNTYVSYGGTRYNTNPNGYIIISSDPEIKNDLSIDGSGATIPEITLRNLTANKVTSNAKHVTLINEGTTNISTLEVNNAYSDSEGINMSVYGSGTLNVTSASVGTNGAKAALKIAAAQSDKTGPQTNISYLTGNVFSTGSFITDSVTYMNIKAVSDISVTDADNTPLYPVEVRIKSRTTPSSAQCTADDGRTYTTTEDAKLYFMLPQGEKTIKVEYIDLDYEGTIDVQNSDTLQTVDLETVTVTALAYDNSNLTCAGGTVTFTFQGLFIPGNVKVIATSNEETPKVIEATVSEDSTDNTVTLTFPPNPSYSRDVIYTIDYQILDGMSEPVRQTGKNIRVVRDLTVRNISYFYVSGQLEGAEKGAKIVESKNPDYDSTITLTMPYDHEFANYYKPFKVEYVGTLTPLPSANAPYTLVSNVSRPYNRTAYTVTSEGGDETRYVVRMYREAEPKITRLTYTGNITSDGGQITVTATGNYLANIANAEKEENSKVYIYLDDDKSHLVEAEANIDSNGLSYIATEPIQIEKNDDFYNNKVHTIHAIIGNIDQTATTTITVPRQKRSDGAEITEFIIDNYLSYDIDDRDINIIVPYDYNVENFISPTITLADDSASYSPTTAQQFNQPVIYTVTSEDGQTTVEYTVNVIKQSKPKVTKLDFYPELTPEEPGGETPSTYKFRYSTAGMLRVIISGENFKNMETALNPPTISLGLSAGSGIIGRSEAVLNDEGDFEATLNVPQNKTDEIIEYNVIVMMGDGFETEWEGYPTITVPAKEPNIKHLGFIKIADGQSDLSYVGTEPRDGENGTMNIYLYVPYNTNLNAVTPELSVNGTCTCISDPEGITDTDRPQDFNKPVIYRVMAEDGTYIDYTVIVERDGFPRVTSFAKTTELTNSSAPLHWRDSIINIDLNGTFIPYLYETDTEFRDELTVAYEDYSAKTISEPIPVTYDGYSGHATASIDLGANRTADDKIYRIIVYVNGYEQTIGSPSMVTIPGRQSMGITDFRVNGQADQTQIDDENDKITFFMSYNTDLTSIKPIIEIDGESYSPTDAQNFDAKTKEDFDKKTVQYTVNGAGNTKRIYEVQAKRVGLPSISNIEITNAPTTYVGKTVSLDIEGIFYYDMAIRAVYEPEEGTEEEKAEKREVIPARVETDNWQWHKAKATIDIPTNETHTDKIYKLEFDVDGFKNITVPSELTAKTQITAPRRTTRAITYFALRENQYGTATIDERDIYVKVKYNTNLSKLRPVLEVDGNEYIPNATEVDFDNDDKERIFTVSAADDDDREYIVHVSREGDPSIISMNFSSPLNYRGGDVDVSIEGIFFEKELSSVSILTDDGNEIPGEIKIFNKGDGVENATAKATVTIPSNDKDYVNSKVYHLKVVLDGKITSYTGGTDIRVPRRKTMTIDKFNLSDIQEGETVIDHDARTIDLNVPYIYDITNLQPEDIDLEYDADSITRLDPPDFSKPVRYQLRASGDTDVIYTVNVHHIGHDPSLTSISVPDDQVNIEHGEDGVIRIQLRSGVDLTQVTPVLEYDGVRYTPTGAVDFSESSETPVIYTVYNEYDVGVEYPVVITKKSSKGGGGGSGKAASTPKPSATPTPTPEPTETPSPTETPEPTTTPSASKEHEPYINGYEEEDGLLFKPDNTITRAEVAKVLSVLDEDFNADTDYANSFNDISDEAWYRNYMNYAAEKGYISGYEDGTSRPDNMITRAEFVSMLSRYAKIEPIDTEDKFSDIEEFEWCRAQINTLAEMGIVNGYEGGQFMPDNNVTRAEVVTMINKLLGREVTEDILNSISNPFADVTDEHWAYGNILIASCKY